MIDLNAEQLDVFDVKKGFKVMFTAPGDDYDVGKGIFSEEFINKNNIKVQLLLFSKHFNYF